MAVSGKPWGSPMALGAAQWVSVAVLGGSDDVRGGSGKAWGSPAPPRAAPEVADGTRGWLRGVSDGTRGGSGGSRWPQGRLAGSLLAVLGVPAA